MIRSRIVSLLFAAAAASVVLPAEASGQVPGPVRVGDRIRLTAPSLYEDRQVGVVERVDSLRLVLRIGENGQLREFERGTLAEIELATGRRRNPLKGLGIGLGVGAVTGAIIGFAAGDSYLFSQEEAAGIMAIVGGGSGALVGLAIGSFVKSDVWTPVSRAGSEISISPLVSPDGAGLAVRIPVRVP